MFEVARDTLISGNLIESGTAHTRQISADFFKSLARTETCVIEAPLKSRPEYQAKD